MRAKTKIRVLKTDYFVKPNNVVVCVLAFELGANPKYWLDYTGCYKLLKRFPDLQVDKEYFVVKGVAKCRKDDNYNETLGKRIAESKAKVKMFKKAEQIYHYAATLMEERIKECNKYASNCGIVGYNENLHVEELCK